MPRWGRETWAWTAARPHLSRDMSQTASPGGQVQVLLDGVGPLPPKPELFRLISRGWPQALLLPGAGPPPAWRHSPQVMPLTP